MKKDLKAALEAVKALLFASDTPPANEPPADAPASIEVKGKDGAVYTVAKMEPGEAITNADGSAVADSKIELEDGKTLVVKDGKIEEIKDAVANADTPPADNPPAETVSKADFDNLVAIVQTLSEKVASLETGATSADAAYSEKMKAIYEAMELLSNESEEKPTGDKKHNAFAAAKTEKEQARASLKEAFMQAK